MVGPGTGYGGGDGVASRRIVPSGLHPDAGPTGVPDEGAPVDPAKEAAIAAIAAAQRGLVTRAQLVAAGLDRSTVRRRAVAGALVPVGARTYRLASAPTDARTWVLAACLDHDAVASHLSAGWLRGLVPPPAAIDVTVQKGRSVHVARPGAPTVRIHTSTNLPPDDVTVVDGIRTTSVARTLLGLAALVPEEVSYDELVDVVATTIETGMATMAWLAWLLDERRCRGRDGVTALEAALEARERMGPTESWLERHFLRLVDGARLPRPALQRRIPRRPGSAARVDFLYEEAGVVVEVLGYAFHRTPDQISADTMRANELQVRGLTVLQLTSRTLRDDPSGAMAIVAHALAPGRRPPLPTR